MKIVILDRDTLGDVNLGCIEALGQTVIYPKTTGQESIERIKDADVVILNKVKLNEDNLKHAENLKLICVTATGYDNIDTAYCKERKIALCNVPGYSTDSVAQVSVAAVLMLINKLITYRSFVHSGDYTKAGLANKVSPSFNEISALKWGVVGGGNIGMKVAQIASSFGGEVFVCRNKKESPYPLMDINTMCKECDIITLHTPLNETTRNLINRERIASMKDGVVIVNTARGAVCDEAALTEAVKSGKIGGLGVDVYSKEPFDESHPFNEILDHENVVLLPHMAWAARQSRQRCMDIISENINLFFSGKGQNRIV